MKLEIYQVGKVLPLTVVECDSWGIDYDKNGYPITLTAHKVDKTKSIIAIFSFNNIAGFKKIEE